MAEAPAADDDLPAFLLDMMAPENPSFSWSAPRPQVQPLPPRSADEPLPPAPPVPPAPASSARTSKPRGARRPIQMEMPW